MNIVAIDTSGPAASCAAMKNGEIVYAVAMNQGLTHSETIMPALDACMHAANLTAKDVDVFAAVAGPGSFTGVRIGVCAVKGLAHAYQTPCVQIDALEALAMNFQYFDGVACPILDARRNQVYCAAFEMKNGLPERILADEAIEIDRFFETLPEDRRLVFLGDGLRVHADKIRACFGERAVIAPANLCQLRAEAACLLAAQKKDQWMEGRMLTPLYLRAPQAERERNARLNEAK